MMNTRFKFGKTSIGRNKFHAHAMRSYFSTQLLAADMDSLLIEFFMGHTIPSVTSSYYSAKPEHLKQKYIRVVSNLSTVPVKVTDIKSPEYIQLEKEKNDLEERNKRNDKILDAFDGIDPKIIREVFKNF